MSNGERSISVGTVIGLVFILLGILYLYNSLHHHKIAGSYSRIPGILFMTVGLVILIIKAVKKNRE
jgi:hypothetical protein